jgi:hypothetical protein
VFWEENQLIIQEAKNSSKGSKLPSTDDIKDGLFKLILHANLDKLMVDDAEVNFTVRLKFTGGFSGHLQLPQASAEEVNDFCVHNGFNPKKRALIEGLHRETTINRRLNIYLVGRG